MLTRNGFPEVYNLKGGITEWQLIEGPEATGANAFSRLTGNVEIEPILMEAYEMEKQLEAVYTTICSSTEHAEIERLFTTIIDEEKIHAKKLFDMFTGCGSDHYSLEVIMECREAESARCNPVNRLFIEPISSSLKNKRDVLDVACKIEAQIMDFYVHCSETGYSENRKEIFIELAEEEKNHFFQLDSL